jgi:hypothetical protein
MGISDLATGANPAMRCSGLTCSPATRSGGIAANIAKLPDHVAAVIQAPSLVSFSTGP